MTPISYKGFTINFSLTDGSDSRVYVTANNDGRNVLNPMGYANVNTAKGAITKHLIAQSVATDVEAAAAHFGTPSEALEVFRESHRNEGTVRYSPQEAPDGPTGAYLPREAVQVAPASVSKPDGPNFLFGVVDAYGDPIAGNPKWAALYAGMRYAGFLKVADKRSRNQREGRYLAKRAAA